MRQLSEVLDLERLMLNRESIYAHSQGRCVRRLSLLRLPVDPCGPLFASLNPDLVVYWCSTVVRCSVETIYGTG